MKKIGLILGTFLLILACTSNEVSNKDMAMKVYKKNDRIDKTFNNEVEDLNAIIGINKIELKWMLLDITDVDKIEILYKQSESKKFRLKSVVSKDIRKFDFKLPAFLKFDIKIRLVSKTGEVSEGKVVGNLVTRSKNVVYDEVEGRGMQIYLPTGYDNSNKRYPVIYMQDGQNMFSNRTSGNGEWEVDETLDRLILEDKVEEMIVVGLYNSRTRANDYSPYLERFDDFMDKGGKADLFAKFMTEKIIPYIDKKYKTIPNRENRAVMGSSLGGLFSVWIGFNYSEYFSMIGAFSPHLMASHLQFLKELEKIEKKDLKVWIDIGTKEFDSGTCRTFVDILLEKGYIYGDDIVYFEDYQAMHTEEAWKRRFEFAALFFKGKNYDNKVTDFIPQLECVTIPWLKEEKTFFIINPVVVLENGLKYSLYDKVTFSVTGDAEFKRNPLVTYPADNYGIFFKETSINANIKGNLVLNGEEEVTVTIFWNGIEKNIKITQEQLNKLEIELKIEYEMGI